MKCAQREFVEAYQLTPDDERVFMSYATLLGEWQQRMNLVAPSTLPLIWSRHFADSAQVISLVATTDRTVWLDIGSGAGFPSLVLARLSFGHFNLVEATSKKCFFLAKAAETLDVANRVTLHNDRIENLRHLNPNIITARACAPLIKLFEWGVDYDPNVWLLHKGRSVESEIAEARTTFAFDVQLVPSRTDTEARIVVAHNVRRR